MAAFMGHGNASSATESSDEDESQRIREAVLNFDFPLTSKYEKPGSALEINQSYQPLPSQRAVDKDCNENDNIFGTTPEFRNFVAKKLAEKLDRQIKFCAMEKLKHKHTDGLYTKMESEEDSTHLVYACDSVQCSQNQRRRRFSTSSSDSSEDDRLAAAAVTEDFLRQEREMLARLQASSHTDEVASVADRTHCSSNSVGTTTANNCSKQQRTVDNDSSPASKPCLDPNAKGSISKRKKPSRKKKRKKMSPYPLQEPEHSMKNRAENKSQAASVIDPEDHSASNKKEKKERVKTLFVSGIAQAKISIVMHEVSSKKDDSCKCDVLAENSRNCIEMFSFPVKDSSASDTKVKTYSTNKGSERGKTNKKKKKDRKKETKHGTY